MSWVLLGLAGVLEVGWALAMKQSQGFTRPTPTLLMLSGMLGSFGLRALAMRELPLGTAYTVWTGIGAVGTLLGQPCRSALAPLVALMHFESQ